MDDIRKSIKVKATFMYNESVSASYAVIDINVTTARTFTELRELLAEANNENSLEITTTGDFTIPEAISVPANVTLKIDSAVTADSNVTVQGKLIAGTGALTVNPSKNIALAAGSAVTVTGKYIVNQGGRITGFIGAGGIIDNSLPSVIILARGGVELSSGGITVIDDWTIFDMLTVKGLITITPTKRVTGAGNAAKIIVEQAAGVTGGIDSLSLGEGVYTWNGSVWQGP